MFKLIRDVLIAYIIMSIIKIDDKISEILISLLPIRQLLRTNCSI